LARKNYLFMAPRNHATFPYPEILLF